MAGRQKKPSHRERICAAIDDALAQKPDSFETLLELLRQAGYEVKGKKVPSLLGGEQKNPFAWIPSATVILPQIFVR